MTAQAGPKTAKEGPKTAQESPKTAQEGLKTAQEGPKSGPRGAQEGNHEPKLVWCTAHTNPVRLQLVAPCLSTSVARHPPP